MRGVNQLGYKHLFEGVNHLKHIHYVFLLEELEHVKVALDICKCTYSY